MADLLERSEPSKRFDGGGWLDLSSLEAFNLAFFWPTI
jgi:hypothetical protein